MKTKKSKMDTSNVIVSDNLPYINIDSPSIKEQVIIMRNLIKNIKQPIPVRQ
jgi:hypothetical protein